MQDSSYASPRDLMERALGSKNGIRVRFKDRAQAQSMKNRCTSVISLDRKKSRKIFQPDEPGYGTCPYDQLTFWILEEWALIGAGPEAFKHPWTWLYINSSWNPNNGLVIEELGDEDMEVELA